MFTLLLLWGWNVLFIAVVIYLLSFPKSAAGPSGTCPVLGCKFKHFILNRQRNECIFNLFLSFDCCAYPPFPRMAEWASPRWLALMLHVFAEDAIRGDGGAAVSPSTRCGLTRRRTQALNNCSHTMATAPGLLFDARIPPHAVNTHSAAVPCVCVVMRVSLTRWLIFDCSLLHRLLRANDACAYFPPPRNHIASLYNT